MSEQWVIGRFVDGRWEWVTWSDTFDEDDGSRDLVYVDNLAAALRCERICDALDAMMSADGNCIMHIEAAQAIAERWAK